MKHTHTYTLHNDSRVTVGDGSLLLIAGPCAVESAEMAFEIAEFMVKITRRCNIPYVFKASFDKANRTSVDSFRSIGMEKALTILSDIKVKYDIPVLTDIHETRHASVVSEVADILQIPAFLCRQTDLLIAAGKTGKAVNIKRGQFMAPDDMQYAVNKVKSTGNLRVSLTERGASFGYHNLVVDMRSLPIMRQYAPVIFDATHSVQMPGGAKGTSGGNREFVPGLARAATAMGIDGLFLETHPDPDKAKSDSSSMLPLSDVEQLLTTVLKIHTIVE